MPHFQQFSLKLPRAFTVIAVANPVIKDPIFINSHVLKALRCKRDHFLFSSLFFLVSGSQLVDVAQIVESWTTPYRFQYPSFTKHGYFGDISFNDMSLFPRSVFSALCRVQFWTMAPPFCLPGSRRGSAAPAKGSPSQT